MEVRVTHHELVTVLAIAGSVDSLTAEHLTNALTEQVDAGRIRLVADFSEVAYTSSAGLRSLLGALKASRQRGGDLRIAALQPAVQRVLALSGFTSIVQIFDDGLSAVASYDAGR
ncbi:MAG: STAS domain-containing protein [Burkholderiaceae bacterium]